MINLPQHIAIIPDGNRRWARENGLPSFMGHRRGAETAEKIINAAIKLGIKYVTLWGCSVDNLTKRDKQEADFLVEIFESYFNKLLSDNKVKEEEVRIRVLGEWTRFFSEAGKKTVNELIARTKQHNRYHITFLMAYSGTEEMIGAVNKILSSGMTSNIDENTVKRNLLTKDLPAVDLVIRTGGEPHWSSGFMMWDVKDSQLYFTETLWPAFSVDELKKAAQLYSNIERRLGR